MLSTNSQIDRAATHWNQLARSQFNLVIRFADNMRFARGIDTIEEHNKVLEKRGAVWFAKFGKTLGMQHVVRLNKQIKVGIKTHMFLVGKQGREYQWFRARLTEVSRFETKERSRTDAVVLQG